MIILITIKTWTYQYGDMQVIATSFSSPDNWHRSKVWLIILSSVTLKILTCWTQWFEKVQWRSYLWYPGPQHKLREDVVATVKLVIIAVVKISNILQIIIVLSALWILGQFFADAKVVKLPEPCLLFLVVLFCYFLHTVYSLLSVMSLQPGAPDWTFHPNKAEYYPVKTSASELIFYGVYYLNSKCYCWC